MCSFVLKSRAKFVWTVVKSGLVNRVAMLHHLGYEWQPLENATFAVLWQPIP